MSAEPIDPIIAHTVSGEVWEGDAFDLAKELRPNSVDLIITSPPFGATGPMGKSTTNESWMIG